MLNRRRPHRRAPQDVFVIALRLFVVVGIFFFLAGSVFLAKFAWLPKTETLLSSAEPSLKLILSSNHYLSLGEESSMVVTVVNMGTNPLRDVAARIIYTGDIPLAVANDGSNTLAFEKLDAGERKTKRMVLMPLVRMSDQMEELWGLKPPEANLGVAIWNRADGKAENEAQLYNLEFASFPYVSRLVAGSVSLLGALVAYITRRLWTLATGGTHPAQTA